METSPIFFNPVVIWFTLGFALMLLELALPGLIVIFFGMGAWVTAFACLLFPLDLHWQLLIFIAVSLLVLLLLRRYLLKVFFKKKEPGETLADEFIGQIALTKTPVHGRKGGTVIFKGAPWEAVSAQEIKAGEQVEIIAKKSITLVVKQRPAQKEA